MRKTVLIICISILIVVLLTSSVFGAQSKYKGFPVVNLVLNGRVVRPASPAIVIDGTTYVPLRFVSESMGMKVGWNEKTQTVNIDNSTNGAIQEQTISDLIQTKNNVTVAVALQAASRSETQIKVTVINNTSKSIEFPASLTQIVAGNTQFDEPENYDATFTNVLRPGVKKEGILKFPALPVGTKSFKVYLKVWDEDWLDDAREYEFDITL